MEHISQSKRIETEPRLTDDELIELASVNGGAYLKELRDTATTPYQRRLYAYVQATIIEKGFNL